MMQFFFPNVDDSYLPFPTVSPTQVVPSSIQIHVYISEFCSTSSSWSTILHCHDSSSSTPSSGFHTNKTKPEEQNLRNFLKSPRCAPGANRILQCDLQH
jgi:hypothetical protein